MSNDTTSSPDNRVIVGRVTRKMKRKHHTELSLTVANEPKTQTLFVKKDGSAEVQHGTCLQLKALVRSHVYPKEQSDDGRSWEVTSIELLECPPDPLSIKAVLQEESLWRTLQPYEETQNMNEVDETTQENYANADHAMVKRIVMRLEKRTPQQPRIRPPHIGFRQLQELEQLEQAVELVQVSQSPSAEPTESQPIVESAGWNLPDTEDDRVLVSGRHKLTRLEYLESKKHPQITWMQKRLNHFPRQPIQHIVDVGGGRGDLAIALAVAFPATKVTVVDLNQKSLDAGRRFADQCGVADRMDWVCEDFVSYVIESSGEAHPPVDMVVALHACGNLSDLALDFAVQKNASFLISPCCYSKMAQQNAATQLAEVSERPDMSRRGMHVVNSERFWSLTSRNYHVLLEEYSRTWSSRNMVLAGWPMSIQ
eukprot:Nitzschia sp. Nitz4//scaffold2_size372955//332373//333647//NITZ4_000471-RA/size372955-processed-gene-0.457-mRNA-1//1//CDS//3329546922//1074//frame0